MEDTNSSTLSPTQEKQLQAAAAKDVKLEHNITTANEALGKHRWEQTCAPDAPFTIGQYAGAVNKSWSTIARTARGYGFYQGRTAEQRVLYPTLTSCQEYAQTAEEKRVVVEAVAKANAVTTSAVRHSSDHNATVKRVNRDAQKVAAVRGVEVTEVVAEVAVQEAKRQKAAAKAEEARKKNHSVKYREIATHLNEVRRRLRYAGEATENVIFTDDEVEAIKEFIVSTKAVLDMFEERVTGDISVTTDWDAAFAAMGEVGE